MKNKKYTVGMIVKQGNNYGVINRVNSNELDGTKASVMWVNGDKDAWWDLIELEIVKNPLEKYRQAHKVIKVIFTDEKGKTTSCEYDKNAMNDTLENALVHLGACPSSFEGSHDFITEIIECGLKKTKFRYFISEKDFLKDKHAHNLTVAIKKERG